MLKSEDGCLILKERELLLRKMKKFSSRERGLET